MALFNVRLDDDLAGRFDTWAGPRGGRSAALRALMTGACGDAVQIVRPEARVAKPVKLTLRLSALDAGDLAGEATATGLSPNAWAAAVLRRRLAHRPTFPAAGHAAVTAIHGEVHRIGVNVNQIARALNTTVMEGKVLDLEMAYIADLRRELREHMQAVREAFEGNLAYWDAP